MPRWAGRLGAVWGLGGVVGLLGWAVVRLFPVALEPFSAAPSGWVWMLYVVSVGFFGITEGYQAFHRRFSPRVAARAHHLWLHPRPVRVLLAPLFCMGFFGAPARRLAASWGVSAGVVLLIVAVKRLPHPWRGAIDLGVCVALVWGAASILYFAWQGAKTKSFPVSAEVSSTSVGAA